MPDKLKIFLSYAHVDDTMKTELDQHLFALRRNNKVEVWNDNGIEPGTEWDAVIKQQLAEAHIILLLISVAFNNSQYIWDNELSTALKRHENGTARVIPIILRTCDWTTMPYAHLQALPTGAKPVSSFADKDVAYTDIARNLSKVVDNILAG